MAREYVVAGLRPERRECLEQWQQDGDLEVGRPGERVVFWEADSFDAEELAALREEDPRAAVVLLGNQELGDAGLPSGELSPQVVSAAADWALEKRRLTLELEKLRRDLLQERSRATEVMAHVSHEMRNPVTVINFMTQLALDPRVQPAQKENHLKVLQSTAQGLLTLLNDLLDFAKLGRDQLTLSRIEFSLQSCLEDALTAQRLVAEDKGLFLELDIGSDLPDQVLGDPGRLRQVLTNLVGNAVKFTLHGGIRVSAAGHIENGRLLLELAVADTGIGIASDALESIFEPYVQACAHTGRKFGGTGLGLTITRQIIAMMGGSLGVHSELGDGTTFQVKVPLALPEVAAGSPTEKAQLKGLQTLVLVPNLSVRRLLEDTLARWEVQAAFCDDPSQLAERCGDFPLLILDLGLPGQDAFELIREVRQSRSFTDLKIVVLTAAGQRGDGARCLDLKVSAYLTQPVEPEDLREALAQSLAARAQDRLITRHSLREQR